MAIVCDKCRVEVVNHNGEICQKCIDAEELAKIDQSKLPRNKIYLEPVLFERFEKLHGQVMAEKKDAKKAMGKFMSSLKTGFINKITGKEINDPTPKVIIPQEKTLDRIQKILNHNLATYARLHDHDTPEDLDDWSVADAYSDEWEQTLFQYVETVKQMQTDDLTPNVNGEASAASVVSKGEDASADASTEAEE